LYNIPIEFCIPIKLIRVIKMCLNETYGKVQRDKHLSDVSSIQNGLKQGDAWCLGIGYVFMTWYLVKH